MSKTKGKIFIYRIKPNQYYRKNYFKEKKEFDTYASRNIWYLNIAPKDRVTMMSFASAIADLELSSNEG